MSGNTRQSVPENAAARLPSVWRAFLRGIALELDAQIGPDARVAILRGTGQQMAEMLTLPAVDSLEALELEMNDVLAEIGWGRVELTLLEAERCVTIGHIGLPRVGSAGEPPGTWLAPVLEGLYLGWMGQQPGADPSFQSSIKNYDEGGVVIRYGR
jgi:Cellulose synthase subunit D